MIRWDALKRALLTTLGIFSVTGFFVGGAFLAGKYAVIGPIALFSILFIAVVALFYYTLH